MFKHPMQKLLIFIKNYYRSATIALVILILTTISGNNLSSINAFPISGLDKLAHFIVFMVFAIFLVADLFKNSVKLSFKEVILIILLISLFYGGIIELMQHLLMPQRTGSLFDLLANVLGSLSGCAIQFHFRLIRY